MVLSIRKLVVLSLVGGIFLLANVMVVAHWLNDMGAIEFARDLRREFLTGTAITIIVALLILLVTPKVGTRASRFLRQCPVCDHRVVGRGKYCSECGSKV